MEFRRIWALRGPNAWARLPVLEVVVDLAAWKGRPCDAIPGFGERFRHRLPSLGGSADPLDPSLALGLATLEFQRLAGSPVAFVGERAGGEPGVVRVAVEFEEEPLARACLELARGLCLATLDDRPFDLGPELERLKDLADEVRFGPSTGAIVAAARERGIPVRRLDAHSLVMLGHASRQRRIRAAESDGTGAVAESIAKDKDLTKILLEAVGVPVPSGRPATDAEDAWAAAESIGPPVVVKPLDGNHGRGVATNLETREQVIAAFAAAAPEGSRVLVERSIRGADYRLLVVGNKMVAAARREPAQVIGDGRSTVAELVAAINADPRRAEGHSSVLTRIKLDSPVALAVLAEQGHSVASVPSPGETVLIRRNANLSTGGTAADVTDSVHPEVAARAVEAARAVGLDIAGIDVVAETLERPLVETGGAVVEVNAGPGLRMHLEPSSGHGRPVGRAIVDMLFPDGQSGRIPIVALSGTAGRTHASRLVAHLLAGAGYRVGRAGSDGVFVGGRKVGSIDGDRFRGAWSLLLNPAIDAAVLETAPESILSEGLGFDLCDVAVVSGVGEGGTSAPSEWAEAHRTLVGLVAPAGAAVLDAADPLAVALLPFAPPRTILYAADPALPALAEHRRRGGRVAYLRDGVPTLAAGDSTTALVPLAEILAAQSGLDAGSILAAACVAWALGHEPPAISSGLASF